MADNKVKTEEQPGVKYKFGEREFDLKKYILNIDSNVKSYLDSKNWSEGQKQEFMNSYNQYMSGLKDQLSNNTGRFSSDSFGNITDNQGVLGDIDNDGIDNQGSEYLYDNDGNQITTSDYNNLKRRKQKNYKNFQANREVVTYLSKIGRSLADVTKEEKSKEKENFNIKKHGFVADWTRRNSASGEAIDIAPYLNMDPVDQTTGKRARTNRINYLREQINNYIQSLEGLDDKYNFEGTSFKDLNEYKTRLQSLSDKLSDGWSEDDMIAANQAGIGASFYNGFFSEEENPNISKEELEKQKEEALKKKNQEEFGQYIQSLVDTYNTNKGQWNSDNAYDIGKLDYWDPVNGFNGDAFRESFSDEELADENTFVGRLTNSLKTVGNAASWIAQPLGRAMWGYLLGEFSEKPFKVDIDQYINEYLKNPYTKEGKRALSAIIGAGKYETISEGPYAGMFYIPQTTDVQTKKGLVYDPNTGKLMNVFIGDIPSQFNKIRDKWKEEKGLIKATDKYSLYKEGGNISSMQIGGEFSFNDFMKEDREANIKARAEANNRTYNQQEAGERRVGIPGDVKNTAQNPSKGFTGTDMLRLGTIAADIVSMGAAFIPGYGTVASAATGAASSLGTFFADAFEDGIDGGDFGRLATNLGMDVLGLIPGGGAASKGAKIAKTLAKYTSRIMATIGAMSTVSNAPKILESFKKLENPSELTVDDWRNISAGLGLVTGGVAAGTRKYQQAKMKAANAKPNNVAVELIDKNNTKKTVLFEGDDATKIRNAKGDDKIIKSITSKYDDYKDWDISTNSSFGWRGLKGSDGSKQIPIGSKKGKAKVFDVSEGYDIFGNKTGKTYALRGKWEADDVLTDDNISRRTRIAGYLPQGKTQNTVNKQINQQQQSQKETKINSEIKTQSELQDIPAREVRALPPASKDVEQKVLQELIDSSNKTRKKLASREAMIKRYHELEQKGIKSYKEGTPGLTKAETREYNLLRRGLAKNGDKHISAIREWVSKYGDKNYKSPELQEFESKYVKNGQLQYPIPGTNHILENTWADIVKKYGLRKKGGTLNMIKVRSFKNSGSITNTSTNGANWYEDMFKHKSMQNWLNTYNVNNYEDFNNLQKSWAANKQATGYSVNNPRASYNQGVFDRQGKWNETGTNTAIEEAFNKGRIRRPINAISGDNASKGYQDGYFGAQEYLRHGGTEESWKGKENELQAFQKELKKRGLNYTLDKNSGMYLLGKLQDPSNDSSNNSTTTSNNQTNPVTGRVLDSNNTTFDSNDQSEENNNNGILGSLNGILTNPTAKWGIPRAVYADAVNRRMTKMAKNNEKTFLQDPFEVHRTVESNLNAEMEGKRAAAQLENMASVPRTSDASLNTAAQMDAKLKGQDYIIQGNKVSDEARKLSEEQAWAQEKENSRNRHNVSEENKASMLRTQYNKNAHDLAYQNKKYEIYDTLLKQFEYDDKVNLQENKQYIEAINQAYVNDEISKNLEGVAKKYGIQLNADQLSAWNKVYKDYKRFSELSDDEQKAFNQALEISKTLSTQLLGERKRLLNSPYFNARLYAFDNNKSKSDSWNPTIIAKNGAKIIVAGIQAKTKDAERFQKQIKNSIDRNEKLLDRLSKSLYGYVKASIVK